ncbi:unnamed protein product [Symbiodinium pilosum]|uniref:PPPDE domain-containing protein n=1 Tax=Symbiodinium pilosum TaxID=2952 RepID=A0A812XI78_SYMPI|nr:unnamed protein product [Symbiodinium pilosum]
MEYSYAYAPHGTGVFSCLPKGCEAHVYKFSFDMGATAKSVLDVDEILESMKESWRGIEYDRRRRNCCLFCKTLLEKLGVGPVPDLAAWDDMVNV